MKKKISWLLIAIMILAGFMLLFYPTISEWVAGRYQMQEIENYDELVAQMDLKAKEAELLKAEEYNNALSGSVIKDPFIPQSGVVLPENYTSILDFHNGLMGYIEIPEIDIALPIYHGSGKDVLEKGIGHMERTAFPIGGKGNNSVLTGHTGLSSAKLFTDLNKLEIGNVFYIKILNETLAYEVDLILVVLPDNTGNLVPVDGEDYVTLVTCTPYAVNTHRLLVRGTRIPYTADETEQIVNRADIIDWRIVLTASFGVLGCIVFVVWRRKKRSQS